MERHFKDLKNEIYKLWEKNLVLSNFTKLPKDLIYNDLQSNIIKPAKKLNTWKSNFAKTKKIHDIIRKLTPYISWKQTYEEKDVGKSFLEKSLSLMSAYTNLVPTNVSKILPLNVAEYNFSNTGISNLIML